MFLHDHCIDTGKNKEAEYLFHIISLKAQYSKISGLVKVLIKFIESLLTESQGFMELLSIITNGTRFIHTVDNSSGIVPVFGFAVKVVFQ